MFPHPSPDPHPTHPPSSSHFPALCAVFCERELARGENSWAVRTCPSMPSEQRTHHQLATLAARQYGVVTRDQLIGLGYSDDAIDRAVASGRLHQWHRSVFAVGHNGLDRHGLCMAAVLFRGQGAMVSFQSAIWLWGFERSLEIPVHVSVRWRGHSQEAIGLHHCPALREED